MSLEMDSPLPLCTVMHTHTHMQSNTHTHTRTRAHTNTRTHAHRVLIPRNWLTIAARYCYIHTHINTHIHTYTHTHTSAESLVFLGCHVPLQKFSLNTKTNSLNKMALGQLGQLSEISYERISHKVLWLCISMSEMVLSILLYMHFSNTRSQLQWR